MSTRKQKLKSKTKKKMRKINGELKKTKYLEELEDENQEMGDLRDSYNEL